MDEDSSPVRKSTVQSLLISSLEFVASNASSFSDGALAALPRRLRINALRLMPVVDLCAAEAAGNVCADFDATECVWRFVGEREVYLGEPMDISIPLRDLEDMFHSVGDRRLSWNDEEWVREQDNMMGELSRDKYLNAVASCLLSSQEMLRNAAIHALYTPAVSRDDVGGRDFARMFSEEYLLVVLLHKCRFQPSSVYIDCTDMVNSGLWTRRNGSFSIVRRTLRNVKQLTVVLTGRSRSSSRVTAQNRVDILLLFRFVLEAVFARDGTSDDEGNLKLTHVTLKGDIETLSNALDHVRQFLSPLVFNGRQSFTNSELVSAYSGIQFFAVELSSTGLGNNARLVNRFHQNLRQILVHQRRLRKLCLTGWSTEVQINARVEYECLIQCVAELFRRPTFRSLLVEMKLFCGANGYENNFTCVMREFLSSPISGQTLKAYCVGGYFPVPCSDFCKNRPDPPLHVIRRNHHPAADKHLVVIDGDSADWLDKFATRCLVGHSLYHNLREVTLEGLEGISDDTLVALSPLPLTAFTISSPATDLMRTVSVEALVKILGQPTLEEITLFDVVCGHMLLHYNPTSPDKLARALTRAMWKHAVAGKLVRLDISRNCLGTVKFQYLRDMFQGLFAFKQLPRTTVFLHDNHFKKEHFQLICLAWQTYAENRRLLQLGASSVRRERQIHTQCPKLEDVAYVIT